jgi:hypothetical protein
MIDQTYELLDVLEHLPDDRPADLSSFVESAPPIGTLPPPQLTWTLIGLTRYRQRKRWAWETLTNHLEADMRRRPQSGLTLERLLEKNVHGIVPGLSEWEFELDGNASFMIHRVSGERIHIDALNGPDLTAYDDFIEYIQKHPEPGAAEKRLAELFPWPRGMSVAIQVLVELGLVHPASDSDFELCGVVDNYGRKIEALCRAWSRPEDRVWLGAQIGDWLAAHDAARSGGRRRLISLTGPRAEACRAVWNDRLRDEVTRRGLYHDIIHALADASVPELSQYLEQALEKPHVAVPVIEVVTDNPEWCPKVYDLFVRSCGGRHCSGLLTEAAVYLCKHDYRTREVIEGLTSAELLDHRVAIQLTLEHCADLLLPLLRRALRFPFHWSRLAAAAVLTLFDTDWSRRELLSILNESDDLDATIECRTALYECRDAAARKAVDEWEQRHPELEDPPVTSARFWYERFENGCSAALAREMSRFFDRVKSVSNLGDTS